MLSTHFPNIRKLDLFAEMTEENFQAMMHGAYINNFPSQIELISEGETSDFLHIVLSGSVELFSTWNRRETCIATIRPISTFILAATVKDSPYLMSARTLEKSQIVLIPSQDVRTFVATDPSFSNAVISELAYCYRSSIRKTKDLKLRTSLERLANYLLRQQKRAGGGEQFQLDTEKRRLASYLNMTPENLSRAFKALQPYGVSVNGNKISISDQADLEKFAKPNPLIDDKTT